MNDQTDKISTENSLNFDHNRLHHTPVYITGFGHNLQETRNTKKRQRIGVSNYQYNYQGSHFVGNILYENFQQNLRQPKLCDALPQMVTNDLRARNQKRGKIPEISPFLV